MGRKKVKFELELDENVVPLLAAIAPRYAIDEDAPVEARAREALLELCDRVRDGVQRPGSWERAWLIQALGDEFVERLESDPADPWHERPKTVAGRVPTPGEGEDR